MSNLVRMLKASVIVFLTNGREHVANSTSSETGVNLFDQSNYILESEEFNPPRESFDQSTIYDLHPQVGLILFFFSPSDRNLTLRTLYCSLVRLNLEYFSVMWSPYTISCLTGIGPCVLFNKWLPNKKLFGFLGSTC